MPHNQLSEGGSSNGEYPAFATGFGKSGTLHADDEYAEVKTLYNGARVIEEFIKVYDQI